MSNPRLVAVDAQLVSEHISDFLKLGDDDLSWTADQFAGERPGKWRLSWSAWDGEDLVGCLIASYRRPGRPHIHLLQVKNSHRSRGVGKQLLNAYRSSAGRASTTLKVEIANRRAMAFYEREGFRTTTRIRGHYWMQSPPGAA